MSRILSPDINANNSGGFGLSQSLTYRAIPETLVGSIIVPDGKYNMYVTGVAAGGSSTAESYGDVVAGDCAIASSENGNYIIASTESSSGVAPLLPTLFLIDPVGRKLSTSLLTPPVQNGGGELVLIDNAGFAASFGGNNANGFHYSYDGGINWIAKTGAIVPYPKKFAAIYSESESLPDSRLVFIEANDKIGVIDGVSNAQSNISQYVGKVFTGVDNANGYFFVGERNVTTKTSLYYRDNHSAANPAGWASVIVDPVTERDLINVAYGEGLYIAAFSDGAIFASASPGGTWTQVVSNISGLKNLKYAGGRFVGHGATEATSSPDGASWTGSSINSFGVTINTLPHHFVYSTKHAMWIIATSGGLLTSSNGITWSLNTMHGAENIRAVANHQLGLVSLRNSGGGIFEIINDINAPNANLGKSALSTSRDGGSMLVSRSSGEIMIECVGGKSNGGEATSVKSRFNQGGRHIAKKINNIPESEYGVKHAGGSGQSTSINGGSILSVTSVDNNTENGYGCGYAFGGGGEGIVRYRVPVIPGEKIFYSVGLPRHMYRASLGYLSFEFE